MKSIAQRELRDRISKVLREVEAGESIRVTVNGRPVADLVPIGGGRQRFVARDEVMKILERAPLDRGFGDDIEDAAGATIDEL